MHSTWSPSTNGEDFSRIPTNLEGPLFVTKEELVRRQPSFGPFGTRIAINEWRAKLLVHISTPCTYCLLFTKETLKHRFCECIQAQQIWQWDLQIIFEQWRLPTHVS
jgi:hypothetical protein